MKSLYYFVYRVIDKEVHETYTCHKMSCVEHKLIKSFIEDEGDNLKFECTFGNFEEWLEFRYYDILLGIRKKRRNFYVPFHYKGKSS